MGLDKKLVFFDMEGTIYRKAVESTHGIAPSAWTLLAQNLGEEAYRIEEESKLKWNRGEYNGYVEWLQDTIKIHRDYGLKKSFFDMVMNSVKFHSGAHETFEVLRNRGYATGLITGGFKAQADKAQIELGIDHSFAACEYFWQGEELVGWNLLPVDYEGKVEFMKLICNEHGVDPKQCGFVGDGPNDVPLAQAVGTSVSFNAVPELEAVVTHVVRQQKGKEDFRAILKYFK